MLYCLTAMPCPRHAPHPPGPFLFAQFKNVANTGVLRWAGQLYALWEVSIGRLVWLRA